MEAEEEEKEEEMETGLARVLRCNERGGSKVAKGTFGCLSNLAYEVSIAKSEDGELDENDQKLE